MFSYSESGEEHTLVILEVGMKRALVICEQKGQVD